MHVKMGDDKKPKRKSEGLDDEGDSKAKKWEEKVSRMGPIAKPLASRKLAKKLYKIIKKAQAEKTLRKGIRDVQKFVRKGEKGLIVIAGDTSPIEVVCHMPLVCEESNIPYCYTPSKEDLGSACGSRRPTCMVLIKPHQNYQELYDTVHNEVQGLPLPI